VASFFELVKAKITNAKMPVPKASANKAVCQLATLIIYGNKGNIMMINNASDNAIILAFPLKDDK
jgi:hypothetical protein